MQQHRVFLFVGQPTERVAQHRGLDAIDLGVSAAALGVLVLHRPQQLLAALELEVTRVARVDGDLVEVVGLDQVLERSALTLDVVLVWEG